MRPEEEEKATLHSTPLAAAAAATVHVTVAAAITTISPNVRNSVRTVIATIGLEAEANRKGTEAVADAEEEEKEEDSTGPIYSQEEQEDQEERHQQEGLATTTGTAAASMALAKRRDSTTNTTTKMKVRTIPQASKTSTGNSTRKTIEAAEAGTSADGHVRGVHSITLGGGQRRGKLL
jgi:hypothetical protein